MKKTLTIIMVLIGIHAKAQAHCCEPKPETCPKVKTKVITKTVEKPVPVVVEKTVPVVVEKEVVKVVDRPVPVRITQTVVKKIQKQNRISGLVGMGPTNLAVTPSAASIERGIVIGVQYQRMINEQLSLGVQIQSNETALGVIGIDF
jgi:hypothetical protein